jgi:hypothetical protein
MVAPDNSLCVSRKQRVLRNAELVGSRFDLSADAKGLDSDGNLWEAHTEMQTQVAKLVADFG